MKIAFEKILQEKVQQKEDIDPAIKPVIFNMIKEIMESRYPELDGLGYVRDYDGEFIKNLEYYNNGSSFYVDLYGLDSKCSYDFACHKNSYHFSYGYLWINYEKESDENSLVNKGENYKIGFVYGNDYVHAERKINNLQNTITISIYLDVVKRFELGHIEIDKGKPRCDGILVPDQKYFLMNGSDMDYVCIPGKEDIQYRCNDLYSMRLLASYYCDMARKLYVDSFKPEGEKEKIIRLENRH